jgi:hypothetical protein
MPGSEGRSTCCSLHSRVVERGADSEKSRSPISGVLIIRGILGMGGIFLSASEHEFFEEALPRQSSSVYKLASLANQLDIQYQPF